MAAAHTPGPWIAETTIPVDNATVFAVDDGGLEWPAPIASCADFEERRPVAEAQANARLIAAAPDMLSVLKSLDALWTKALPFPPEDQRNPDATNKRWRELRAAIAKAEGRS